MATNIGKIGSVIQSYLQQANKPSAIQPTTPASGSTVGSGLSAIGNLAGNILGAAAQNPSAGALINPYNIGQYNAINQGYATQLDALNKGTEQYITTLNNGAEGANAALDNARSNAIDQITRTYDDSARNYYRLYKRQEKDLPEQLSSVGATGGASESAALNLMNNYSDNLYKNEYGRNQQISGLNEDYYNAIAQNSQQLAQQIANAYLNLAESQAQLEGQKADAMGNLWNNLYSQYQSNKQAEAQAKIDNWNAMIAEKVAGRTSEGYDPQIWTDASGRNHYTIKGQTSKTDIAKANAATDKKIAELRAKGYKVYTYTNADGTKGYTYSAPKGKSKNKDKSKNDDDEAKPKTQTQGLSDKGLNLVAFGLQQGIELPNGQIISTSPYSGVNAVGAQTVFNTFKNFKK